ncbi:MAG: hypothetical protein GW748_08120 [Alphaproteobacteria bacterium]|nr:hypothetical protein [Alphaproteobacteria bacterium]NCQ67689.1 hypothetical protein [Alphaproteobacteria bacterium]NCT07549.1 hypothetical protein [Alphaproteobacteria bacterium]
MKEKRRIFFTQRLFRLKTAFLISFFSLLPCQKASSSAYETVCSFFNVTGEIISDITHQFKYSVVSVSPDHFPELTLGQVLTALEENALQEGGSIKVCQDLHFEYMKDEYPGLLSFSTVDFGSILGETRFSSSSTQTFHNFLTTSIPEADLTKSFQLLRPEISPIITIGGDEEKWRKTCLYEYVLSNPPTGTNFKRVYIRLTAWRKRK